MTLPETPPVPVADAATVRRVPQNRGVLSEAGKNRIKAIQAKRATLDSEYRDAVLDEVALGASVRELAAFTGLSTNTISRWKREGR